MQNYKNTDIFNDCVMPKPAKHRLDEQECSIHKVQKLDATTSQDPFTDAQKELFQSFYQLKKKEVDLESYLQEQSAKAPTAPIVDVSTDIQVADTSTNFTIIKNTKTLAELNDICNEPIITMNDEEAQTVRNEIQKIANLLKNISKPKLSQYQHIPGPFEITEANFTSNLKILYNSLLFKHYDFTKGAFNPEKATILYGQIYKVNVYLNQTANKEFTIYFGFPFYLSLRLNTSEKVFISRRNIYKILENREEIEKIHFYSDNTGFNVLDVITAAKFIDLIISKYFVSSVDLLTKLLHILELYKINSDKIKHNKIQFNFERFATLYKQVIKNISMIPILN